MSPKILQKWPRKSSKNPPKFYLKKNTDPQKLLKNLKFGVVEGQYYMAPISALWLFSASAILACFAFALLRGSAAF